MGAGEARPQGRPSTPRGGSGHGQPGARHGEPGERPTGPTGWPGGPEDWTGKPALPGERPTGPMGWRDGPEDWTGEPAPSAVTRGAMHVIGASLREVPRWPTQRPDRPEQGTSGNGLMCGRDDHLAPGEARMTGTLGWPSRQIQCAPSDGTTHEDGICSGPGGARTWDAGRLVRPEFLNLGWYALAVLHGSGAGGRAGEGLVDCRQPRAGQGAEWPEAGGRGRAQTEGHTEGLGTCGDRDRRYTDSHVKESGNQKRTSSETSRRGGREIPELCESPRSEQATIHGIENERVRIPRESERERQFQ